MAINNVEIIRQLRKIGDYEAEKLFIKDMDRGEVKINDKMDKLYELQSQGHYVEIFIPYLNLLGKLNPNPSDEQKIKEAIDKQKDEPDHEQDDQGTDQAMAAKAPETGIDDGVCEDHVKADHHQEQPG